MKYIYKHGNQFWYQRAIPQRIQKIVGKTSIKICLKTNKISTAVKRSKLQALEHTKMFKDIKKKTYFSSVFKKKNMNIKNYTLNFLDEYEDLVTKFFFSKKKVFENIKQRIEDVNYDKKNISTVENYLFNIQDESLLLSIFLKDFSDKENVNFFPSSVDTIKTFIKVCGDKILYEYDSNDYEQFKNFLKKNNLSVEKKLNLIFNFISFGYKSFGIKEKVKFKKKLKTVNSILSQDLSDRELHLIYEQCNHDKDLESLMILLLLETGCKFSEIIGLDTEDIYLDNYLPFIIIRSNKIRKIQNLNKLRTVPLVGSTLLTLKKMKEEKKNNFFLMTLQKRKGFRKKVSLKLKKIIPGKGLLSFQKSIVSRLIKINCPERVILDIIGQSKKNRLYKDEISLEIKASWLKQISKFK